MIARAECSALADASSDADTGDLFDGLAAKDVLENFQGEFKSSWIQLSESQMYLERPDLPTTSSAGQSHDADLTPRLSCQTDSRSGSHYLSPP